MGYSQRQTPGAADPASLSPSRLFTWPPSPNHPRAHCPMVFCPDLLCFLFLWLLSRIGMITALIRGEEKVKPNWSGWCLVPRGTDKEAEAAALIPISSFSRPPSHFLAGTRLFCASGPLFTLLPLPTPCHPLRVRPYISSQVMSPRWSCPRCALVKLPAPQLCPTLPENM